MGRKESNQTNKQIFTADACPALTEPTEPTTIAGPNIAARKMNDALVIGLSSAVAVLVLIILAIVIAIVVYKHRYVTCLQIKTYNNGWSKYSGNENE